VISRMNVSCNHSDIATSSRLTPSEEAELRNIIENKDSTQPSLELSSTHAKVELNRRGGKAAIVVEPSEQNSGPNHKKIQSRLSPPPSLHKYLTAKSTFNNENRSQIQASVVMDNIAELETLATKTNGVGSNSCELAMTTSVSPHEELETSRCHSRGATLELSEQYQTDYKTDQYISNTVIREQQRSVSSGVSIVSASPALISTSDQQQQQQRGSFLYSQVTLHQHHYQHTTASLVLEAEGSRPSTVWLDPVHFKTVFHELAKYTKQFGSLNDQILESMTLYQPMSVTVSSATSPTSARTLHLPEEARKKLKGKDKAMDLEEDRDRIAQCFTEFVVDVWPLIYKPSPGLETVQMTKHQIKMARRLKDAIEVFCGVQAHFQEQAQLVLDVYQDPTELEHVDRIHILKCRHLNNLLIQHPLDAQNIQQLLDKYKCHHNKMETLLEQLQNVWLGIFMLLGDPDQKQIIKLGRRLGINSIHLDGNASSSSSYHVKSKFTSTRKQLAYL
ncbi:hypothetical protein BGZ65_006902, partial [Modicella reniformis]